MELHSRKTNNGRGAGDGPLITLRKVGKSYVTPAGSYPALRDIDLEIGAGEFVALVGKSGSGKITLLNLIRRPGRLHSTHRPVSAAWD
jgi:ABC-type lipoprotein export system ATPase subunit